jgi:structural maintenance of chromosomes protein 6
VSHYHFKFLTFLNFSTGAVTVEIRNQGEEAYRPEIYGPKIIVERKFSKDGASRYEIRDYNGKSLISIYFY